MIIRKMTASYGKLQNHTLELKPGLNIVTAPNESGKSTWCSFIKNMLYGIDSSAREKGGVKPDKTLYAPWSGSGMSGSMELEASGREISLSRTGSANAPMRELTAVYTGTSQPVKLSGSPGEALLGIPREVFERTAFIGQGSVAVSASPELEKRIAAIVQTGDEAGSFTGAEERLRAQARRRRFNKSGALPELERQMDALRDRLGEIGGAEENGARLREALKRAIERRAELTAQVAQSREKQRKAALDGLSRTREKIQGLESELDTLRSRALSAEAELKANRFGVKTPDAVRETAARDIKKVSELVKSTAKPNPAKRITFAVALFALSTVALALFNASIGYIPAIISAVLLIAAVIALIVSGGNYKKHQSSLNAQIFEIFTAYGAEDEEGILEALAWHKKLYNAYSELCARRDSVQAQLFAERESQAERERSIVGRLDFSVGNGLNAELTRRYQEADEAVRRLREDLAAHEGRLGALGAEAAILEKIAELSAEHKKLALEYDALVLAADTLREAGTEIQNRMTPRLSRRASEIFAQLTGNRYSALALDRDLRAMAQAEGDSVPRESAFLSVGALDQLYLAVRLALCELALPEDEPCPLVLDDALGSFDDERCALALSVLGEVSKTRQIILFTCQEREQAIVNSYKGFCE